jgi:hypothetical protein
VACIKDLNNIIGDYRKANDELRQALNEKGIDQLKQQLEEKEAEIDERDAALLQYHDHAQVLASFYAKLTQCPRRRCALYNTRCFSLRWCVDWCLLYLLFKHYAGSPGRADG